MISTSKAISDSYMLPNEVKIWFLCSLLNLAKILQTFHKDTGVRVPNFARFLYIKLRASVDFCDMSVKYCQIPKKNLYFVIIGRHSKNPIRSWLYISQKHFKYVYCLVNYNTIIKVFILFLCCFRDVDNCLNLRRGPDESFNLNQQKESRSKKLLHDENKFWL